MKAYLLPNLRPTTMAANSCESITARLASSANTQINPPLTIMLRPTLNVRCGEATITRARTRRGRALLTVTCTRRISPVQADDIVILIFDPTPAETAAIAGGLLGCHIEDDASYVALKLTV